MLGVPPKDVEATHNVATQLGPSHAQPVHTLLKNQADLLSLVAEIKPTLFGPGQTSGTGLGTSARS